MSFALPRADTEKQVKGYGGRISHRGYTKAQGGYKQALIDFKAYVNSAQNPEENRPEISWPSSKSSTLAKPAADAKENIVVDCAAGGSLASRNAPNIKKRTHGMQATDAAHGKRRKEIRKVLEPFRHNIESKANCKRPVQTVKCTNSVQPTKNVSAGKKMHLTEAPQPMHHTPKSSQQSRSAKLKGSQRTTQTPNDSGKLAKARSSHDKRQPSTMKPSRPDIPTDYIVLSDSDSDDEFDSKSLDLILSQSFSQTNPASGVTLCKEQADLVEAIASGQNVFYTGSAGCGKSTVLKSFVERLRKDGKIVDIVAPTGRAALNVGGCTFWRYAGWTPGMMRRSMEDVLRGCHNKRTWERFNKTHVLVIDEISMMENFCFERLNRIMKEARNDMRDKPFGGVQVVVCGDFCQLPPVQPMKYCLECGVQLQSVSGYKKRCLEHGDFKLSDQWAFMSAAWRECNFLHVNLTEIHRQKDLQFIGILEKLRLGKLLDSIEKDLLKNHQSETDGAVKLYPKKDDVRRTNDREFNRLQSPILEYPCHDHLQRNPAHEDLASLGERDPEDGSLIALNEHRFERRTELRIGTVVVHLVNSSNGLVNGSQGVITGFDSSTSTNELTEAGGEYAQLKQTLIHDFIHDGRLTEWPVVRFLDGKEKTIFPHCMITELGPEEPWSLISRTQIPLMAAWAMTIHKAQGMTLNRVIVDLADTFETGHDYVALSRAECLDGLKIENLGMLDKGMNRQVKEFLEEKFGVL